MKKILLALSAVALLFATSCQKENINPAVDIPEGSFLATIDNGAMPQNAPRISDGMGTMTKIDANRYVTWEIGDQIAVNGCAYATSTAGNSGVFAPVNQGNQASGSTYHAFYPASIAGTGAAGTLPATQTYVPGKVSNLPMYASSSNNQLTFHNICAVFAVTAPSSVQVASIELSTPDDLPLWGTFSVDANNKAVMNQNVDADHKKVTLNCNGASSEDNTFYIALPAGTYSNIKVTITTSTGSKLERQRSAGADAMVLDVNKIYTMSFVPVENCFRFKAIDAGAQIGFSFLQFGYGIAKHENVKYGNASTDLPQLEYSTDGFYWSAYTPGTPLTMTNADDEVMFRAPEIHPNAATMNFDEGYAGVFSTSDATKTVAVKGNIMTLLNGTTPPTDFGVTQLVFGYLFMGLSNLVNASELTLPSAVTDYCYWGMFYQCPSLVSAPALPATVLAENCYQFMFQKCTSLTTAPALPATTLAPYCYNQMFASCSSLTSVPDTLPAMTISENCYELMFANCTSLTTAPVLPATTLEYRCYLGMFEGCSSLTAAPELNAQTLAGDCYYSIFEGCTKLSSVKMTATDVSADNCLCDWLDGAGTDQSVTTRTVTVHSTTTINSDWYGYIDNTQVTPSGWRIVAEGTSENLRGPQ